MPMFSFATYRAKVEHSILFMRIVNRYLERQQFFSAAPLNQGRETFKSERTFFCFTVTSDLASEKFVLASESNLSLVTGLAS